MAQPSATYNTPVKCPSCEKGFEITKVRIKQVRYTGQDTDLCPKYEGENPLFYDSIICSHCGFAHIGTNYENLTPNDFAAVKEKITARWVERDFSGPRTVEQAIAAYKIVQMNMMVRAVPNSENAKICLRLAWMNRVRGDTVTEFKFLEAAFHHYESTYTKEHLPVGKLDEFTVMFMLGELGRRIGRYNDSLSWFGRLLSAASIPENKKRVPANLVEMSRDLIQLAKDEQKEEATKV